MSGARRRLAVFARTLRDNGFKIGLAETSDALAILGSPLATWPSLLKPALRALFCATHSDWERFDEIFAAFWQGEGMRQRQVLAGMPAASAAPARRLAEASVPEAALGLPDRVERRSDGDGESAADGRGRREGATRAESLSHRRSRRDCRDACACGAACAHHARAARSARAGTPQRSAA
jgi:uncharacterized protein with von Willebrand factor type A (vWA) domain